MTTGYEGKDDEPEIPAPESRKWELVRPSFHYTTKVVAQLTIDGEPVGLIYFPDERHLEWVRKKLASD